MGKNTQLSLLGLVFVLSGAVGYLIEGALWGDGSNPIIDEVQEVVPIEVLPSSVPVVEVTSSPVKVNGKYAFAVTASAESGDVDMKYVLYSDQECTKEVDSNYDGRFEGIQATESQTYFLKVKNIKTEDWSEVLSIAGFIAPQEYKISNPMTLDEIQAIINDYSSASSADIKNKIAKEYKIECRGLAGEDRGASTLSELSNNLVMGVWASAQVMDIDHDSAGRINNVVITVTYP